MYVLHIEHAAIRLIRTKSVVSLEKVAKYLLICKKCYKKSLTRFAGVLRPRSLEGEGRAPGLNYASRTAAPLLNNLG